MQTGKQVAIFDCKAFNAKLPKEQWKVKADSENVQVTITYSLAELPEMFKQNGRPDEFTRQYASRTERENASHENREAINDRVAVRFKLGANCKWFDKFGKSATRPTNAELDGKKFEVNIDFARKAKQIGNPLAPSGYWCNAIMFRVIDDNPFAGQEFEQDETPEEEQTPEEKRAEQALKGGEALSNFVQHSYEAGQAASQAETGDEDDGLPF